MKVTRALFFLHKVRSFWNLTWSTWCRWRRTRNCKKLLLSCSRYRWHSYFYQVQIENCWVGHLLRLLMQIMRRMNILLYYDKVGVDDDVPRCTSQRGRPEVWCRTRWQAEAAATDSIQRRRQQRRRSKFQEMKPSDFGERKVMLFKRRQRTSFFVRWVYNSLEKNRVLCPLRKALKASYREQARATGNKHTRRWRMHE